MMASNIDDSGCDDSDSLIYLGDLIRNAKFSLQEEGNKTKRNGVTYAIFGASGSGKSTLIREIFLNDVYSTKRHPDYISVLFTESKFADPLEGLRGIPIDSCGVDGDIYQWMWHMNYTYDKRYNFIVLIDDVITVRQLPVIFKAFLTYRNMNITSIVSLQYLKLCPLSIRTSLYFIFFLPLNSCESIEQVVKGYLAMYLSETTWNGKILQYQRMCQNHCFFMMDNLNHKCYYVNNDFYAKELHPINLPDNISLNDDDNIGV